MFSPNRGRNLHNFYIIAYVDEFCKRKRENRKIRTIYFPS